MDSHARADSALVVSTTEPPPGLARWLVLASESHPGRPVAPVDAPGRYPWPVIQTLPETGWFLYGPEQAAFDCTWRSGRFQRT